jgi:hypothetical protein
MTRRYYRLQEFFLGYLHPDWRVDAATMGEVVDEFLATADGDLIDDVAVELDELLGEDDTEDELNSRMLHEYSLFYDPRRDGLTMRAWLEELRSQLGPNHPGSGSGV